MRPIPDSTSPRWLAVGTQVQAVQIITRWFSWFAHFDPVLRRKVRCGGAQCAYCDAGSKALRLFVVGVWHAKFGRCLFEMRDRHELIIQELNAHESEGVGQWIQISRLGTAQNSPIDVSLTRWEACNEWDIRVLVESLGLTHSEFHRFTGEAGETSLEHEFKTRVTKHEDVNTKTAAQQ